MQMAMAHRLIRDSTAVTPMSNASTTVSSRLDGPCTARSLAVTQVEIISDVSSRNDQRVLLAVGRSVGQLQHNGD